MLILLFYFNNISSRLSQKKIVKGTPRNRTSTLPHQQHSHKQQAIVSYRDLREKITRVNNSFDTVSLDQRLPHLSTPHYSALFSVLQRTSALFSVLQRSSALITVA